MKPELGDLLVTAPSPQPSPDMMATDGRAPTPPPLPTSLAGYDTSQMPVTTPSKVLKKNMNVSPGLLRPHPTIGPSSNPHEHKHIIDDELGRRVQEQAKFEMQKELQEVQSRTILPQRQVAQRIQAIPPRVSRLEPIVETMHTQAQHLAQVNFELKLAQEVCPLLYDSCAYQ